jgi:predicted HicB family RNase H-like nuclease
MSMKKKSSVITPPPQIDTEQGIEEGISLSEQDKKDALIKLIRKGAPSVPVREEAASDENERVRFSVRISRGLLERITGAADNRDVKTPVNTWITEALLAQLKKEGC